MADGPDRERYRSVEAAILEMADSRWFLEEFSRRNRAADTAAVLEALAAAERRIVSAQATHAAGDLIDQLRAAAASAAALRATLASHDAPERTLARALGQCGELEDAIRRVTGAAGGAEPVSRQVDGDMPANLAAGPGGGASAEEPALASPESVPPPKARPRMPAATVPSLLDGLSDEERAVLFA